MMPKLITANDPLHTRLRRYFNDAWDGRSVHNNYAEKCSAKKNDLVQLLGLPSVDSGWLFESEGTVLSDDVQQLLNKIAGALCEGDSCIRPASKRDNYTWHPIGHGEQKGELIECPLELLQPDYHQDVDPETLTFQQGKNRVKLVKALKKASFGMQVLAYDLLRRNIEEFWCWEPHRAGCLPRWDVYGPKIGDYIAASRPCLFLTPDPVLLLGSGINFDSCHRPGHEYQYGPFVYASDEITLGVYAFKKFPSPEDLFNPFKKDARCLFIVPDVDRPQYTQSRVYEGMTSESLRRVRDFIGARLREYNNRAADVWRVGDGGYLDGHPAQMYPDTGYMKTYVLSGTNAQHYSYEEPICPCCLARIPDGQKNGCCFGQGASCTNCGGSVDDDDCYTHDGDIYCESCYSDEFTYCGQCDESARRDDMREVYGRHGTEGWCTCCADRRATECDDCGALFSHQHHNMHDTAGGGTVCESCMDNYSSCYECGTLVPCDEITSVETAEEWTDLCECCAEAAMTTCDDCSVAFHESRLTEGRCEGCHEAHTEKEEESEVENG